MALVVINVTSVLIGSLVAIKQTWEWISNFNSWKDEDFDRFRNDGVGNNFYESRW